MPQWPLVSSVKVQAAGVVVLPPKMVARLAAAVMPLVSLKEDSPSGADAALDLAIDFNGNNLST